MAVGTGSIKLRSVPGDKFFYDADYIGPTTYTTGGDVINTPAFWGLQTVSRILVCGFTAGMAAGIADFQYNRATGKLQLFTSGGVEVANGVNCSSVSIMCEVYGS